MQQEQAVADVQVGAVAETAAASDQAEAESNDPLQKISDLIGKRLKETMEERKKSMDAAKANDVVLDKANDAVKALVKVCEENGIALAFSIGLDKDVITARRGLSGNRCLTLFMIKQLECENING